MAEPTLTPARHWRLNIRLTLVLLLLWAGVTFGVAFYARELNEWTIFGFPLGFYMGAQGALLINAAIIAFYAWVLKRWDRRAGVPEDDAA